MPDDRRDFLKMLAAAGLLSGCAEDAPADSSTFFKDTASFIAHGSSNMESCLEHQEGFLTPQERSFVRKSTCSLDLNAEAYRLKVVGDAVGVPLTLSCDNRGAMPGCTVVSYSECGDNQRSCLGLLTAQARLVQLNGLDQGSPEGDFRRPLPAAKALDPDTISGLPYEWSRLA